GRSRPGHADRRPWYCRSLRFPPSTGRGSARSVPPPPREAAQSPGRVCRAGRPCFRSRPGRVDTRPPQRCAGKRTSAVWSAPQTCLPSPVHEPLSPAPLWRRLTAFAYDPLARGGLGHFVALGAAAVRGGPIGSALVDGHVRVVDLAAQLGLYTRLWLVTGLYYALSWRCGGQTLGMRPWRVQAQV